MTRTCARSTTSSSCRLAAAFRAGGGGGRGGGGGGGGGGGDAGGDAGSATSSDPDLRSLCQSTSRYRQRRDSRSERQEVRRGRWRRRCGRLGGRDDGRDPSTAGERLHGRALARTGRSAASPATSSTCRDRSYAWRWTPPRRRQPAPRTQIDVFFNNSPVFRLAPNAAAKGIRPVMWFDSASPLRSGWAWGQNYLEGGTTAFEATVGPGQGVCVRTGDHVPCAAARHVQVPVQRHPHAGAPAARAGGRPLRASDAVPV